MTEQQISAPEPRSLRQRIEAHLGSEQVSRVVYGSILGLALVLVLEAHPPSTGAVIGSLLATGIAAGLAELYSEIIGTETRTRRPVKRSQLPHMLADVGGVVFGVSFPCLFFVVSALGWIEQDTAFTLAVWSGLGLIGAYGFVAARFAGAGVGRALVHAAGVATVAGLLIAIKALIH
ncbi:MAG TPA: hypothetical protein VFZ00_03325 [Solirubrobacter sp.]|jgi:hypothetical protein|nr:hypothetical protein [Solirubrobacter sp.]